jgi:tRNA1Val (adenine37-N6)-methyltransferase
MKKVKDFVFKQFKVSQDHSTHKVGTDGVLLGAWVNIRGSKRILDIGTGSGVIALMLAQRNKDAIVDALEIQETDARQAETNFLGSPWPSRLKCIHKPVQQFVADLPYDLIVSNPPYFSNSFHPPTEKRVTVRHTTSLPFDDLLSNVTRLLSRSATCGFILPAAEANIFIDQAKAYQLFLVRKCDFRSRSFKAVERVLMELSFEEQPLMVESLVLYAEDTGEEWSDDYKRLTRDFYLRI